MERPSLARILRVAEYVYAALALFALTQGPVYQLWRASGMALVTVPEPSIAYAHFATFIAVQLPGLMLATRSMNRQFIRRSSVRLLLGFLVLLSASVLWSTLARHSMPEVVSLVFTTMFGIYLALRFSNRERWAVIAAAMTLGLALSSFAVWHDWTDAVDRAQGYWIGIYFNRNSLAPVAAVGVIASVALAATNRDRAKGVSIVVLTWAVTLGAMSLLNLWQSQSQTSPFAISVAVVFLVLWSFLRRFTWLKQRQLWWSPAVLVASVCSVAVFVALRTVSVQENLSGETSTFNSRGVLWSLSWSGFLLKPLQGWGWLAAWHTPDFFKQGEWWAVWDTQWSHNGYHDLLLGGGVVAALLFAAYVFLALRAIDSLKASDGALRIAMAVMILAAATQESFFIGSHFFWALLLASLTINDPEGDLSVNQHNSTERSA